MSLNDKISQIKDEHAAELVDQRTEAFNERSKAEAYFLLGRIKQNDHIAVAISTNLTAQTVRALEHFQEEGMYRPLGYTTFVDFLEKSEYSPMSKRQYYERRELMNTHGDEIYDLLTSVGISVRAQKMLGKGDLAIKGDRLCIGDKEVEIGDAGVVKDVLNELFEEKRELQAELQKAAKKNEKQAEQLDRGQADYDELQRNLDALKAANPHDRAVARLCQSALELVEVIGQTVPDDQKARRGSDAIPVIWSAVQQIKAAYGTKYVFEDAQPTHASADLDELARLASEGFDA